MPAKVKDWINPDYSPPFVFFPPQMLIRYFLVEKGKTTKKPKQKKCLAWNFLVFFLKITMFPNLNRTQNQSYLTKFTIQIYSPRVFKFLAPLDFSKPVVQWLHNPSSRYAFNTGKIIRPALFGGAPMEGGWGLPFLKISRCLPYSFSHVFIYFQSTRLFYPSPKVRKWSPHWFLRTCVVSENDDALLLFDARVSQWDPNRLLFWSVWLRTLPCSHHTVPQKKVHQAYLFTKHS